MVDRHVYIVLGAPLLRPRIEPLVVARYEVAPLQNVQFRPIREGVSLLGRGKPAGLAEVHLGGFCGFLGFFCHLLGCFFSGLFCRLLSCFFSGLFGSFLGDLFCSVSRGVCIRCGFVCWGCRGAGCQQQAPQKRQSRDDL